MIAVILIGRNHSSQMRRCLESLANSDVGEFHLFYWDNGSTEDNAGVVRDFVVKRNLPRFWMIQERNLGIVIPKLRLMNMVRSHGRYGMVLDIHTDMLFPKVWFRPLVFGTGFWEDPLGAIAYPSILQSPTPPDTELLESWVAQYSQGPQVILDPIQTQPSIIKTNILDPIGGYVDPAFHPMFVDDDDLRCRVWKAGYTAVGSGKSWVWHQGGLQSWGSDTLPVETRNALLVRNTDLFEVKHGMSVKVFKDDILYGVHPAVQV